MSTADDVAFVRQVVVDLSLQVEGEREGAMCVCVYVGVCCASITCQESFNFNGV